MIFGFKGNKILLLCFIICTLIIVISCSKNDESQTPGVVDQNNGQAEEEKTYCPLDHTELDEDLTVPPVMVSIDNLAAARPQSGLEQADLVYEIPAEGGVSRFLAVYYHGYAEEIGPVRSARPYFVDMAKEYDAVFVHAGGSQDALNYLSSGVIKSINEFAYGKYFWRDKSRQMPHNLYTSSKKLTELLREKDWDQSVSLEPFKFAAEETGIIIGVAADTVEIDYPSAHNTYKFDSALGIYLRFIKDQPHCDRNSGHQLKAANIIVQYMNSKVLDSEGRLAMDMTGEGKALLFSGGKMLEGKWTRSDLESRTVFSDSTGEEWTLNPGQTWIQVIDQTCKVSYQSGESE